MTTFGEVFALVKQPDRVLEEYARSDFAISNRDELARLRACLHRLDPSHYRGISRRPLTAFRDMSPAEIEDLERRGWDFRTNERALRLLRSLAIPSPLNDPSEEGFLLWTLADAERIRELLDRPGDYEIVRLLRDPMGLPASFLGFDVGYWGSDHFSLICDSAIMPRWHPPDREDYDELAANLDRLNQHALFDTLQDAHEFRLYYMSKAWAETENYEGQFCIIGVGAA